MFLSGNIYIYMNQEVLSYRRNLFGEYPIRDNNDNSRYIASGGPE